MPRIFQNYGLPPSYRTRLAELVQSEKGFHAQRKIFLSDRYGASHILRPAYEDADTFFFTNGDDERLQRAWAQEKGLSEDISLASILLAQIEDHRTEVFYNVDPVRYGTDFLQRLPGTVRTKIAWRAAPGVAALQGYDAVVSNFPSLRHAYEKDGLRTAELFPSHDPSIEIIPPQAERDIDVLFFGGYSRHHAQRRKILEAVASLSKTNRVSFHLDNSRYTKLADTPLGWFGPLSAVRRPAAIRAVAAPPVFGLAMYRLLARAKIVINAAIDMAGVDRGNMRCFEATGAGALLLTDEGNYPEGFRDGQTMVTYGSAEEARTKIVDMLASDQRVQIARDGQQMIAATYSKHRQYRDFTRIYEAL
ncbi:glycosyltransferase family protein [Devosia riboflavina]